MTSSCNSFFYAQSTVSESKTISKTLFILYEKKSIRCHISSKDMQLFLFYTLYCNLKVNKLLYCYKLLQVHLSWTYKIYNMPYFEIGIILTKKGGTFIPLKTSS